MSMQRTIVRDACIDVLTLTGVIPSRDAPLSERERALHFVSYRAIPASVPISISSREKRVELSRGDGAHRYIAGGRMLVSLVDPLTSTARGALITFSASHHDRRMCHVAMIDDPRTLNAKIDATLLARIGVRI